MAETQDWAFAEPLQANPVETQFDLARALNCMVLVRAEVPADAFTAPTLGTERAGYGCVIGEDGVIATIGYLISEATEIWVTTNHGVAVRGHPVAYDQATGFGLIQPLAKLDLPHLPRGSAATIKVGETAYVLGHGGRSHSLKTQVIAKQEFAGPWEYLLDEGIYTTPPHPQWGGAALVDSGGNLIGVGSLLLQHQVNKESTHVNMFVPIDLLNAIFDVMVKTGRSPHPPHPWLGMFLEAADGKLVVGRVSRGAPAAQAGIQVGDTVLSVSGAQVRSLAEMFRAVWRLGAAGVEVPLSIARAGDILRITVRSADRNDFLKKPQLH